MFSRIVSCHDHDRNTRNDSAGLLMLIRWIITSDLCTARDCQQFRKESGKPQSRIMFQRNYSFYHHCCCLAVTGCSKNSNLSKAKWGGTSNRWRGLRPLPGPS